MIIPTIWKNKRCSKPQTRWNQINFPDKLNYTWSSYYTAHIFPSTISWTAILYGSIYNEKLWYETHGYNFIINHINLNQPLVALISYANDCYRQWLYHYQHTIIPFYHYTIVIVILLPRHNCSSHGSRTEALPKNRGNYNVAPQVISWFISPSNYSYLCTINHSYWGYWHQLSCRTGPHIVGSLGSGIKNMVTLW